MPPVFQDGQVRSQLAACPGNYTEEKLQPFFGRSHIWVSIALTAAEAMKGHL